jgi:hypothetical protein
VACRSVESYAVRNGGKRFFVFPAACADIRRACARWPAGALTAAADEEQDRPAEQGPQPGAELVLEGAEEQEVDAVREHLQYVDDDDAHVVLWIVDAARTFAGGVDCRVDERFRALAEDERRRDGEEHGRNALLLTSSATGPFGVRRIHPDDGSARGGRGAAGSGVRTAQFPRGEVDRN